VGFTIVCRDAYNNAACVTAMVVENCVVFKAFEFVIVTNCKVTNLWWNGNV